MTNKVLGFYEKDARKWMFDKNRDNWGIAYHYKDATAFEIETEKLVSVRLASESVGLKALKEYCNTNGVHMIEKKDLLCWAEKEAEKQ